MSTYKNKEYVLELDNTYVRPDFICLTRKKIIEFDGDYWHSPVRANPEREKMRDHRIANAGYKIFHVFEYEYKQNKDKVLQECINFLTQ